MSGPSSSIRPPPKSTGSRLGAALQHVRSVEAHPPHHAHFDVPERAETPTTPDSLVETPGFGEKTDNQRSDRETRGKGKGKKDMGEKSIGRSRSGTRSSEESGPGLPPVIDIEHVPCDDDPREWSRRKKNAVLAMMTIAVVSF